MMPVKSFGLLADVLDNRTDVSLGAYYVEKEKIVCNITVEMLWGLLWWCRVQRLVHNFLVVNGRSSPMSNVPSEAYCRGSSCNAPAGMIMTMT